MQSTTILSGSNTNKQFGWLYGLFLALEAGADFIPGLPDGWHYITKPLLLVSLIGYWLLLTKGIGGSFKLLILVALGFSLLGDVLLLFDGEDELFFILGLGAFLVAQLTYAIAFSLKTGQGKSALAKQPWWGILPILYAGGMYLVLQSHLGAMKVPVGVYVVAISLMGLSVISRWGRVGVISFRWGLVGGTFFLASDTLLGWNTFVSPLPWPTFFIMFTYGVAQYALVRAATGQSISDSRV